MADREKIEYVRYYASGSAAHKVEEPVRPAKKPRPVVTPKAERIPIPVDPVAIIGMTVAVVMALCILLGFAQVNQVNAEISRMESTISTLKSDQYALQKQFNLGIDIEEIRTTAQAMGLVPISEVRHITITLPEPEVEQELSWWEELWMEFQAMFE